MQTFKHKQMPMYHQGHNIGIKTHKPLILSTCCCVEASRDSQVAVTSLCPAASVSSPCALSLELAEGLVLVLEEAVVLADWLGVLVRRLSASAKLVMVSLGVWVESPTP